MTTADTTGTVAPPARTHAGRRYDAEQGGALTGTWTLGRDGREHSHRLELPLAGSAGANGVHR